MYDFSAETLACHLMGELILHVLFNTESHDSPHRLKRGVTDDSGESFLTVLKDSL